MSDVDVRKGFRAMISGGVYSLGDEQVTVLGNVISAVQSERGLSSPTDDVAYLQEFITICEDISFGRFDSSVAQEKLNTLNAKFPNISVSVKRNIIIGHGILPQRPQRPPQAGFWHDCL